MLFAKSFPSDESTSMYVKLFRISCLYSSALRAVDFRTGRSPSMLQLNKLDSASGLSGLSSSDLSVEARAWSRLPRSL